VMFSWQGCKLGGKYSGYVDVSGEGKCSGVKCPVARENLWRTVWRNVGGKFGGGGDFPVGNVPDKTLARNFRIPMQN